MSKPRQIPNLQPLLHDAATAPIVDTSPRALDLNNSPSPVDHATSPSRVKRMSSAVEKLSRSISGKSKPSPPSSPPSAGHRRLFSLSRKGKGKDGDDGPTPNASRPSSPRRLTTSVPAATHLDDPTPIGRSMSDAFKFNFSYDGQTPTDDSPFVAPDSPRLRPALNAFQGQGSMRAGTQTLIQAIQALPWAAVENDDDMSNHDGSSEDEEDDTAGDLPLASSIHTIHRPVARSRLLSSHHAILHDPTTFTPLEEEQEIPVSGSESEDEAVDFERTPQPPSADPIQLRRSLSEAVQPESMATSLLKRVTPIRTGSMATVRLQRRAGLAKKLKEVFELDDIDEVWAEMPCWLLRSILLQGYMYLTNSYLCFFAHMPSREDQVLKSGSLNKKTQRTKRWVKHWFVLKNDALSWYQSSSDPYFPHGIVDLRYAISCDHVGDKGFRIRTNQKTVQLLADSGPSREEWVKSIRKVIFRAQNMGDSVKIAIPYSLILDVDKSSAMDFSETLEVKVFDKMEQFSVDSYFFAYFHDINGALEQIREAVQSCKSGPEHEGSHTVLDTTVAKVATLSPERASTLPADMSTIRPSTSFRLLPGFLRPIQETLTRQTSSTQSEPVLDTEDFMHVSRRFNSASFVPVTTSPPQTPSSAGADDHHDQQHRPTVSTSNSDHTYPPSTLSSSLEPDHLPSRESSLWSVPSWLKGRRVFGSFASEPNTALSPGVKEVYSPSSPTSSPPSGRFTTGDMAFSILETPDTPLDSEVVEKFRTAFAYDEKEKLLGYFPGYIYRLLPIFGRLYVSTNNFCFKSSGPLSVRTRMALPIRDILSLEESKATRFGHHGLIVIVRGHEELFFEFGAEEKRDAFANLLRRQMEDVRKRLALGESEMSPGKRDALVLEEFDYSRSTTDSDPSPAVSEAMAESLPAVMFTSASSTFLTFKPNKSLRFTFLTIGSRGDVQPYISLAKGLMADGHQCKIATHGEFKDWIESHGIKFGYVGGDPAELMRICVENGTFTVSFLKEGLLKFRGWVDDLLKTSWEACQDTDVLVESPSAMGGYHIAEALAIPYFRAFTMTWSRTRAYPHAFAVPDRKMGGGYNYMTYVMFDQVFWRATAGQINRWRRNTLHLEATSLDRMEPHKIPFLYNFSPSVVPPPLDWPEWIRVTGYWFLDDADVSAKKWTAPADLLEFIDGAHKLGKKIVYIGFGSIVVSDPKAMTQCVIEAVVKSGVYAILSKGWSDRLHVKTDDASEPEEPLPKQIYAISSIPHDWLFQRIDAACHHGGAGTTGASLRAGIPTIIRPFFGDQLFWADRVEALGVGTAVRKLTVSTLTEALLSATTDVKQIDRARLLGEQIRRENGVATAIEAIYRDLEYARSLIKHTIYHDSDADESDKEGPPRRSHRRSRSNASGYSSAGSAHGAPSEDWSVIDDQEARRSFSKDDAAHRTSFATAMLSVLPDKFAPGSPPSRPRSNSNAS